MPHDSIDLRSDTVTCPTPEMRAVMAEAPVGDDVTFGDPSVNLLQEELAARLGKEAALFVPSGTMSNQIGVRVHCNPGDEFICEAECHILNYEQGAYAQLSGLAARSVAGVSGVLELEQLKGLIRPENEHLVRTRLLCLENTHNRGGGCVLPYEGVEHICRWAHDNSLATHLDGARLFNAEVASGIPAADWAQHFDTVSICFSKGLGAPVGSALAGTKEHIAEARRHRKLFGGGMRQAGIIAAGALYALRHHVERLADDHDNARRLGETIRNINGLQLTPEAVETNLVIFRVDPKHGTASQFSARLEEAGVRVIPFGSDLIRAVTHLDVSQEDVQRACEIFEQVATESGSGKAAESSSAYA